MALQLKAEYTKKVGLPGYSSHGLNLTLTREVTSLKEIDEVVAETYQLLQDAVDRELVQTGWLPDSGNTSTQPSVEGSNNGTHRSDTNGVTVNGRNGSQLQPWNCSEKQRNLIQRVAREQGLSHEDLNALAEARYGKPVNDLNKLEASGLIDELLDAQRQPVATSNGRNGFAATANGRKGR